MILYLIGAQTPREVEGYCSLTDLLIDNRTNPARLRYGRYERYETYDDTRIRNNLLRKDIPQLQLLLPCSFSFKTFSLATLMLHDTW